MSEIRPVSNAEWVARAEMMNEAIVRWTKKPRPEPCFSDRIKKEPVRRSFEYFAGRFYDTADIRSVFSDRGATTWRNVILMSHTHMYGGTLSMRAKRMLVHIIRDHNAGAPLPPFVLATYVNMRKEG